MKRKDANYRVLYRYFDREDMTIINDDGEQVGDNGFEYVVLK